MSITLEETDKPTDLAAQAYLTRQLRDRVPSSVWARLEYLQPEIGCLNACSFCSQTAGSQVWQLTARSQANLFVAIKRVIGGDSGEIPGRPLLGFDRDEHKPGVIFPYLDNDIFSYPHLYEYIRTLFFEFGCKVRLTTVGFSRHSSTLADMHGAIARHLTDAIDGLRISISGYPRGSRLTHRVGSEEYVEDIARLLEAYQPVLRAIGIGRDRVCMELRFAPLVDSSSSSLDEGLVDGQHYVHAGSTVVVGRTPARDLSVSTIAALNGRKPVLSTDGAAYTLFVSDSWRHVPLDSSCASELAAFARQADLSGRNETVVRLSGRTLLARLATVHQFVNADGPYYAINPTLDRQGYFDGLQIYPRTERRTHSGVINSARYHLNAVIDQVATSSGGDLDRWDSVEACLARINDRARWLSPFDHRAAEHVAEAILPISQAVAMILRRAGLPPRLFFDRRFAIDTGQIVNQGRAWQQFGGLASASDIPLSPNEERGYGAVSFNSLRGPVFRIAPAPVSATRAAVSVLGRRNHPAQAGGVMISQLDGWLRETGFTPIFIDGLEVVAVPRQALHRNYLIPGLACRD